jgi:WD40 repeat protein
LLKSQDGTLIYWNIGPKGQDEPAAKLPFAHDMAIWELQWHPAGHMLATGSNDRQTKFWARPRFGTSATQEKETTETEEMQQDEIELGNHVGIVIGRKGQTIISMQRSTGTKMHVDQNRRTLLVQGTATQIATVRKRVGALLERVSNEERGDSMMTG